MIASLGMVRSPPLLTISLATTRRPAMGNAAKPLPWSLPAAKM